MRRMLPPEMSINVLFFAAAKDAVGKASLVVHAAGKRVDQLLQELTTQHPVLAQIADSMMVAVNQEYADMDQLLKAGDEVALIPPVSVCALYCR